MKPRPRSFSLFVLFVLFFAIRYWQVEKDFQQQLEVFPKPVKGTFRVWVREEPQVLFDHAPDSHDTGRINGVYQPFVRDVRAVCEIISLNGTPVPPVRARCTLRDSSDASESILSYGDVAEVEGRLNQPSAAMNPGQFDYAHFLKTKGTAYVLYARPGMWRKVETSSRGLTFLKWSYALKREAEERIYRYLPYPQNALLDGILLGERASLPEEITESFFLTGTIHILAVSGMITAFVAGLFFMTFRVLGLHRKWAALPSLVALLFFIFMTGANPPVCRAGLFSALALLAVLCERRIHSGVLLLTTAGTLMLVNPFVLQDLSFQISFLATAGLMAMSSWFMEKLSFLPREVAFLVTASIAAQLAVACLILYDFNQISVYSVLANLLIVPLTLFVTAGGLVLLLSSCLHPALGTLFGAACWGPLKLLVLIADTIAKWPKAEWVIASPPLAWVLVFHGLLLAAFYFHWPRLQPEEPSPAWKEREVFYKKGRRWVTYFATVFILGTGVVLLYVALSPKPLKVTFLAVGHGNAVVLESPNGKVFLVDGGKETKGPDRYLPLAAYLRSQGIEKVDGILDTHPDEDHVGGLVNILSGYPVAQAYEASRAQSTSAIYQDFKTEIAEKKVPLRLLRQGDRLEELIPATLEVLHPSEAYEPRLHVDNNRSVVSLISFGGTQVLLPGDLEKAGLLELLHDHKPFPPVDWLLAPHHGRDSGEPALCESGFHPRFVVLSDWRDYLHARSLYEAGGAKVLSTALDGAIELEVKRDGSGRYRTFLDPSWREFTSNLASGTLR